MSIKKELLGDFFYPFESFLNLEGAFREFQEETFRKLSQREKFKHINKLLLKNIQESEEPCFLLPAVLDFIQKINIEKVLHEQYRFTAFEFWLNRFSKLTKEENQHIRAKIVGKKIPREEYQSLFPIGMGNTFKGTHFVSAHASPDIDTTIASFWGWVDAFGAQVAEGLHHWSLPGVVSDAHFMLLFHQLFGPTVFDQLARTIPTLTLTAQDLVTQKEMIKVSIASHRSSINHNHIGKAVVLVDDDDNYIGDWRSQDAESVRQIIILFTSILMWFENTIHAKLIRTFAKKSIHQDDIDKAISPTFMMHIKSSPAVIDYSESNKKHLNDYLKKILGLQKGTNATFEELGLALDSISNSQFSNFMQAVNSLNDSELYDKNKKLVEDRPKIFSRLEKIIKELDELIFSIRDYVEQFAHLIDVKEKVLGDLPQFVTLKSDVEEIRSKINNLGHLTVAIPESNGKWFPVGVVFANDLKKSTLGTVSLRDFSNENEVQMASYLEVISVIDHHKTQLETSIAPTFLIADAQSANTIVGEQAILINEKYSVLGIDSHVIDDEMKDGMKKSESLKILQRQKRLLQLKMNSKLQNKYFIHPRREFIEYVTFLYAILDDTDLLTKISPRDVFCVQNLLNRMKSISLGEDVEIINFDDLPKDATFTKQASIRILQNPDMYSIYKKIYEFKAHDMESHLAACASGKESSIFSDVKEQNGCCRISQTKIFASNYPFFQSFAPTLRTIWFNDARKVYEAKNQVDFHLHMISTIAGAEEVFKGNVGDWDHKDEIWLWVPSASQAMERLVSFLNAFQSSDAAQKNDMEVEFTGANFRELSVIFQQNFPKAKQSLPQEELYGLPIAILRFKAGSINSRKAQISPYLPRLVP